MLPGCVPWPTDVARRYRAAGYWRGIDLHAALGQWCAATPDRTAIIDGERGWTYRELDAWTTAVADGLWRLGLRPGDRVVTHLPNRAELVVALFAMCRIGVLPILALPAHRHSEIAYLLKAGGAVGYLTSDWSGEADHIATATRLLSEEPALRHVIVVGQAGPFTAFDSLAEPGHRSTVDRPDPADVAFFLLSGGSTGRPKLIPRTHDDYLYNIAVSTANAGLTADTVYLTTLPVAHNYALGCPGVLGTLSMGGTVVCHDGAGVAEAFALIERHRVTMAPLVPPLAHLWTVTARATRRDLSSLRLVQVGGQRLGADIARRIGPALGCRLQQSFGMAEGMLSQSGPDDDAELTYAAQGRPISPADEVLVVDPEGRPVPPGTPGELLVRGPYTIRGYYRAEQTNRRAFTEDGYFRTGDLVRRLPSGHLVVEGRLTDVINRGGDKVSPDEVEEHLRAHPAIREVVLVSVPDALLGEQACAVAVLRDEPVTLASLTGFLRDRGVARYKWPDRLKVVTELPTTAVGKISRAELRAWLVAG